MINSANIFFLASWVANSLIIPFSRPFCAKLENQRLVVPTRRGPLELCNLRDSARLQIAYLKSSFNFHSPASKWEMKQRAPLWRAFYRAAGKKTSKQDISFHHLLWRPSTNETDTHSAKNFSGERRRSPNMRCKWRQRIICKLREPVGGAPVLNFFSVGVGVGDTLAHRKNHSVTLT